MNGYGYGGGGYGRSYGGFRPPVYPRGRSATKSWNTRTQVLNINANPGNTQVNTTIYTSGVAFESTIKHITLSLNAGSATTQAVFWAVVYVPAGTTPAALSLTTGGLLYPNPDFILASGSFIADADSEPIKVYSPLARKLNASGLDSIAFCTLGTNAATYQMVGTVKFAVGI